MTMKKKRGSIPGGVPPRKRIAGRSFKLRVVLEGVKPQVWRQFVVPASITLDRLHDVLQAVMGWTDSHLHDFTIAGQEFTANPEEADDGIDETGVVLGALVRDVHSTFTYRYDVGDDWVHTITVESVKEASDSGNRAVLCLDGKGRCPPEDVGGPEGYAAYLRDIANPRHAKRRANLDSHGGSSDPEEFDVNAINLRLAERELNEWTHLERLAAESPFGADEEIFPGGFNYRDEANALIAMAVRNGPLEDLHAGRYSAFLADQTLSRLTDKEMKTLMLHASKKVTALLRMRDASPELYERYMKEYGKMYCRFWERDK